MTRRSLRASLLTNLLETVNAARHARRVGALMVSHSFVVSSSGRGFISSFVRIKVSEMGRLFGSTYPCEETVHPPSEGVGVLES